MIHGYFMLHYDVILTGRKYVLVYGLFISPTLMLLLGQVFESSGWLQPRHMTAWLCNQTLHAASCTGTASLYSNTSLQWHLDSPFALNNLHSTTGITGAAGPGKRPVELLLSTYGWPNMTRLQTFDWISLCKQCAWLNNGNCNNSKLLPQRCL